MIVTVTAALDSLEVVALGSLDVAEAGAAAHDVDDQAGDLGACAVGDTFLLQGHTGAGRRSDDTGAGTGSAVYHVDSCNFALGLQEATADLGHTSSHVFRNLRLGSDGVTEEKACAGANSGFRDSFATLHKSQSHVVSSLVFFNVDDHIGASTSASRAANARLHVRHLSGAIALSVDLGLRQLNDLLGASSYAEGAAFAPFFIDGYSNQI